MSVLAQLQKDGLVIATHNKGKLREIEAMLAPLHIQVSASSDHNLEEPEENGETFEANAAIKSEYTTKATGKPALSDDSGLEVEALQGAPGIFSARWGGPQKDFYLAMDKVKAALDEVEALPPYKANFTCVLALSLPEQPTLFFRGEVHGQLEFPPRGTQGFGYDPIFVPEGHTETFGEIDPAIKHQMSHRANAFSLFCEALKA